jgi:DNA-binding transcriptional ArsR family regulator
MEEEKKQVLEAIKKGLAQEVTPTLRKRLPYLRAIGEKQPCTIEEIANEIGKTGKSLAGLKAVLTKLTKKGLICSVEYQGKEYYLLKAKYDELRASGTKTS